MNEIEERKVQCYDLLRKAEAANVKVKEWQAEIQRLAIEINELEAAIEINQLEAANGES